MRVCAVQNTIPVYNNIILRRYHCLSFHNSDDNFWVYISQQCILRLIWTECWLLIWVPPLLF